MKRSSILLVTIGLILIVSGGLWMYLSNSFTKDKEVKTRMKTVIDNYDKFQEKVSLVTGEREVINDEVVNNYFDEEVAASYDDWFEKFRTYEESVKKVDSYKKMIVENCVLETYKNTDVLSKCDSMIIGYETVINYFVKDVESLNKFIDIYNSNYPDDARVLYLTDYKYIDINDDGKYLGK